MENELTAQDKQRIEASIRGKYLKVAASPEGSLSVPHRAGPGLRRWAMIRIWSAACRSPLRLPIAGWETLSPWVRFQDGEAVLDIGCGAGVDSIIAARLVGPSGAVTAIDLVPEMLARASENARLAGVDNVTFRESSAEQLPFPDNSFDVVISNGVFNLVVDKVKALGEVFRVLKPGGRFMLADQVLAGELPKETKARVENWAR